MISPALESLLAIEGDNGGAGGRASLRGLFASSHEVLLARD